MSTNKNILKVGMWSSAAVAFFTVLFMVALPLTFKFDEWIDINTYADTFKIMDIFTVVPSFLLASSYVIFTVAVHYYAPENKKIWSHLGIVFGLMYAVISSANYLIQMITVAPSLQNNELDGLTVFAPGYSYSIFFALMASYFFMCISAFFISFVFNSKGIEKIIKYALLSVGAAVPLYLLGICALLQVLMPLGALLWFIGLVVGCISVAIHFKRNL